MMPLPDNQQPPNADKSASPAVQNPQPEKQAPQQPQGGLMMPLPDNQQPPNADKGPTPPAQNKQQPQNPPQQ
jgi:hypothetical protein